MQTDTQEPTTDAAPSPMHRPQTVVGTEVDFVRSEIAWLGRGLRAPGLYLCLVGALILWGLVWQGKSSYHLDLGGLDDNAYVGRFYDKEPDRKVNPQPAFTYRWSRADSDVRWPGLGNVPVTVTLRLAGGRPAGTPPPVVTATVRGQTFPLTVENDLRDYSFAVDRGSPWDGDLDIALHSSTFVPPGDSRALGVLVAGVSVTPVDPALGLDTVPPLADLARWAAALVLLWLLTWRLTGDARLAQIVGAGVAGTIALGALTARPSLGLLASEVPALLLWAYPLAVLTRRIANLSPRPSPARGGESVLSPRPSPARGGERSYALPVRVGRTGAAEAVAGALVVGFLLRVGGMVYPQFLTSDILLHVHNIEKVLAGTWVWTGTLPNGAPQPYPPLPYLVLAPFAGLVPDLTLLLKFGVGLLDAACVLPLFYLGSRLGGARAGAWAGWVYALLPAPFILFSAGVFAYLFAACVFTWTLAAWGAVLLAARPRPFHWGALGLGFFLTLLSAYGMLIAAVSVAAAFVLLALVAGPALVRRRALWVAATLVGAGLLAFAAYYIHFVEILLVPAGGVNSGVTPPSAPARALLDLLGRRLGPDLGWGAVLAAIAGWVSIAGRARGVGLLVGATALAGLGFAALSLVAGENIRYPLLYAPLVAVGAGLLLSRVTVRGVAGRGLALSVAGLLFWHLLEVWIPLILTRYH